MERSRTISRDVQCRNSRLQGTTAVFCHRSVIKSDMLVVYPSQCELIFDAKNYQLRRCKSILTCDYRNVYIGNNKKVL